MAAFLWQAIHYERSVIVSGGTASGKTTMLNALLALVPPRQRTITIEDTRELELPSTQENWVALRTRTKNPEGFGEVTMLDLLVNSLRMRPDRIVMGEIRKKEEAEVLFEAMHTGHSTYGTVHADTAAQLVERLIEPPFSLPPMQVSSLDLVVVQYRDRRSGKRRTLSITEVLYGKEKPRLLGLFAHKPRQDSFCSLNKPKKYYSLLALHTGMTEREIIRDQIGKRSVLRWMVRRKMCDTHTIGRVMREYYNCSEALVKAARKNANPAKVL
jgi:flagellar protein FlaI